MSALGRKVLDLAEQQGLLDGKAIKELRRQVGESKFVITPEAIAKVLVDHGHLTPFQARKLVSQAQGNEPDPIEKRTAEKAKASQKTTPMEDLTFADGTVPVPEFATTPDDDDEIVELEAVDLAPEPAPARPSGKKPPPSKSPGKAPPDATTPWQPPQEKPPSLDRRVEGSTAEDFVELEPVDPTPPARGTRWKTDAPGAGLNETIEMTPVDLSESPATPAADLVPIDDLFGPDPFPAPKAAPAPPHRGDTLPPDVLSPLPLGPTAKLMPVVPVGRPKKNVWDSPLMLLGGGALGLILVAFAILLYALTRGSAAEMFGKAEEEYKSGSYGSAGAIYEKFLKHYPDDPNASLARVRRGMGTLRQVTDDAKNPRLGLETATQVLPQIETEEKFSEARSELATILPEIADGFATQASQAQDPARKQELVKLAGDALALVNNPSYLPASLRKDRESHIARIVDKLKLAERGIQQDKDLATTVEKITAAADKGDVTAAYQIQSDLLRSYPGLATNAQLVTAIRQAVEKERQLVAVTQGGAAPLTKDHSPGSERVVLAYRDAAAAAGAMQPVFILVEGAVYGLDASSGRVLWRRFAGYETMTPPIAVNIDGRTDAVLVDGRRHELVRLNGTTGELVWRQELGDNASGPVLAGSRILVTTRKGRIVAVEAASGEVASAAQLPQGASVAPAVRQTRVFQLGEHSTLFVLDANSLACTETVYLGHKAGAIFVPPVAVLDQVLIVESPSDDFSQVQVLSPDAKTKRLAPFGKPQRLKGRITSPLAASGARVAAVTDLGQVAVYEVDPGNPQEHLRYIAGLEANETTPRATFCELERDQLWTASRRRTLFQVQVSLSQLARRWTENHDDRFIAPLSLAGDVLLQVRRRSGVSAVLVEGCRKVTGETLWTTHLAAPIAALVATDARQAVDALTADGRMYTLRDKEFKSAQIDQPTFSSSKAGSPIFPSTSLSADGQTLVWTESQASGRAYIYDVKSASKPAAITLPGRAVAPAVPFGTGALAPLANGSVALVTGESGQAKTAPFMPPLAPDALPQWTRPAVLADQQSFLISDGRGAVYAVARKDQPQPQLNSIGESKPSGPVVSPLVLAGPTAFGVIRQERSDAVAGFNSQGAAAFEPVTLEGRVEAGPFAVGGLALVAAEPDGLVCFGGDGKVRWQQPLSHGPLAGPLLGSSEGDLVAIFQSGEVCRLDAASGKELACHDIGERLLGPACILGQQAFVAGSDGVVHRVTLPKRP